MTIQSDFVDFFAAENISVGGLNGSINHVPNKQRRVMRNGGVLLRIGLQGPNDAILVLPTGTVTWHIRDDFSYVYTQYGIIPTEFPHNWANFVISADVSWIDNEDFDPDSNSDDHVSFGVIVSTNEEYTLHPCRYSLMAYDSVQPTFDMHGTTRYSK